MSMQTDRQADRANIMSMQTGKQTKVTQSAYRQASRQG